MMLSRYSRQYNGAIKKNATTYVYKVLNWRFSTIENRPITSAYHDDVEDNLLR
jgi:hypothetical protein